MNRLVFRTSVCALALVLAAGCGDSGATGNQAAGNATATVEYSAASFAAAADALSARLSGGTAPAASDPAVAAFESQSASALQALGTAALPVEGFTSYDGLCGKTATIVGAYVNLGVDPASATAAKAARMNANAEKYIDQMFTPLLFSAHCTAAHMPFIESQISDGDMTSKAAALHQIRDGAYGQAGGLLQMASSSDIDAARRARIVDLLAADAGKFAVAFNPQQRAALSAMVDSLPADVKGKGAAIKSGLTGAACGKLCAM
jgi:hypothetical protein